MAVDLSKLAFESRQNYLKRSEFVSETSIALGSGGANADVTITHGLGYVPFFIVGVDIDNDGVIWSNDKVNENTETSRFFFSSEPTVSSWATTTGLTINILNSTVPAQTGSRKVYYGVYLDYSS